MLASLRQRLDREDDGFTLIELMVVVLIIAILIAIAIPTFLGVQNRAKDRAAQSDLRNAMTAAKTLATDNAGFFLNEAGTAAIAHGDMTAIEGSLEFGETADTDTISVTTAEDGEDILLVKQSGSDTYYGIAADKDGAVTYCSGDAAPASAAACTGSEW